MLLTYETFRDVPLPIFDPVEPQNSWPVRSSYTDISSGGAYRANGSQRSPKGRRTLRRSGTLLQEVTTTDQAALAALREAFALLEVEVGNSGRLVGKTEGDLRVWTTAELLSVNATAEPRTVYRFTRYVALDVECEFVLPNPAWYGESLVVRELHDLYDDDESGLLMMGIDGRPVGDPVTFSVAHDGNLPSSRVVVTITSGTGTITAVTLTNNTTGHVMTWVSPDGPALGPGDVLVIDAGARRVSINDAGNWAGFTEDPDNERWFELAPGLNTITLEWTDSATDDTSVPRVEFWPTYA